MKRILLVAVFLVQLILAGTVMAATENVNFGALGPNSVDITVANNPAGYTLNGVTFRYDDQGQLGNPTALVNSSGIHGSTLGALIFDFSTPATAVNFRFSLYGIQGADPLADGIVGLYFSGGSFLDSNIIASGIPDDGTAMGLLDYSNASTFDQAVFYFSLDAVSFSVCDLSYQTPGMESAVPLPATIWLFGAGMAGIAAYRRKHTN